MEEKKLLENQQWESFSKIQLMEDNGEKKVFVRGNPYMSWKIDDQVAQRVAIVELYRSGISSQEELANIFGAHVKSIYNYINTFEVDGMQGLVDDRSGPKGSWKLIPELRGKILTEVLKNNLKGYVAIKNALEKKWQVNIGRESIRQVLLENSLGKEMGEQKNPDQLNFWEEEEDSQLILKFNHKRKIKEKDSVYKNTNDNKFITYQEPPKASKGMRYYSSAEIRYIKIQMIINL